MLTFLSFLKRYWQPLAIALLITICYLRIAYIKAERDSARQTIADMQLEAIKKNAEVALLKQQGKRDTEALQASYNEIVTYLLKGKSDDKKTNDRLRSALADKLRQQSEDSDKRVPKDDADRPAGGDSHGNIVAESEESEGFYRKAYLGAQYYIETLEQAGALCAADYNACKDYIDQEQKRIGVYAE